MNGKMLVQCPVCESRGIKQILGEIKDGFFIIMRFHNAFTKIRGEFEVICSNCSEPVYFKRIERREYEVSNNWSVGFYRSGTIQEINQARTLGSVFA